MVVEQGNYLSVQEFLRFTTQLGVREEKRADVIRRGFALAEFLPEEARAEPVIRFMFSGCPSDEHWPPFLREGFGKLPPGIVKEILTNTFDRQAKWLTTVNQVALGYFREARRSIGAFLAVVASLGESQLNRRWVPVVPELLERCEPAWFEGGILEKDAQSVALNQDVQRLFGQVIADIAFNQELEPCLSEGRRLGLPGECADILDTREKILAQLRSIAGGAALPTFDFLSERILAEQPAAVD